VFQFAIRTKPKPLCGPGRGTIAPVAVMESGIGNGPNAFVDADMADVRWAFSGRSTDRRTAIQKRYETSE
jgi:hypothetical protein